MSGAVVENSPPYTVVVVDEGWSAHGRVLFGCGQCYGNRFTILGFERSMVIKKTGKGLRVCVLAGCSVWCVVVPSSRRVVSCPRV